MLKGLTSETRDTQYVFRKLLTAMSQPGQIQQLDMDLDCPGKLHMATGAIFLSMLDFDTPLNADISGSSEEIQWLRFHTGMPFTRSRHQSLFAVVTDCDQLYDPAVYNLGSIEDPHRSTTLLVQTWGISENGRLRIQGPGIKNESYITIKGIKESFWINRRELLSASFPLGVDMVFICENRFVALPRTTRLEMF